MEIKPKLASAPFGIVSANQPKSKSKQNSVLDDFRNQKKEKEQEEKGYNRKNFQLRYGNGVLICVFMIHFLCRKRKQIWILQRKDAKAKLRTVS